MVQPIRSLYDVYRKGGSIHATCTGCGRVALFSVTDLFNHFSRKGLTTSWPHFAKHLVCKGEGGCGARNPKVAWWPSDPPPDDDPPPPRPRFARAARPPCPIGVDADEWQKAWSDRDRRRLIRVARG